MQTFAETMRRSIASQQAGLCCCRRCVEDRGEMRFCGTVCPVCGDRSCPKLSDHRRACKLQSEPDALAPGGARTTGAAALPDDPAEPSP